MIIILGYTATRTDHVQHNKNEISIFYSIYHHYPQLMPSPSVKLYILSIVCRPQSADCHKMGADEELSPCRCWGSIICSLIY